MPELPARPDFEQLRHQAKDLLTAARYGDRAALARVGAVSERHCCIERSPRPAASTSLLKDDRS